MIQTFATLPADERTALLRAAYPKGFLGVRGVSTVRGYLLTGERDAVRGTMPLSLDNDPSPRLIERGDLLPALDPAADPGTWAHALADFERACTGETPQPCVSRTLVRGPSRTTLHFIREGAFSALGGTVATFRLRLDEPSATPKPDAGIRLHMANPHFDSEQQRSESITPETERILTGSEDPVYVFLTLRAFVRRVCGR